MSGPVKFECCTWFVHSPQMVYYTTILYNKVCNTLEYSASGRAMHMQTQAAPAHILGSALMIINIVKCIGGGLARLGGHTGQ